MFVGGVEFANDQPFSIGFSRLKNSAFNFKYTESLYIIDIKSGGHCQFDSLKYFHNKLKICVFFIKEKPFYNFITGCWPLASGRLGCWDARKLGSPKVCNFPGSNAFELSCLIASWPPSKKLTFEPMTPACQAVAF
jgi:hypothetical protein